ncbi:MAG TPA: glycosyltransferase family 2 protein [Elusimicrobiota bacterium]|nr:glycosyltransferase family 2 protein [Elusimicrobiota bacterium]
MTRLSIVVPVFNEEEVVSEFYRRLKQVLRSMDIAHEIIFVDDGSRDNTVSLLLKQAAGDDTVKVIEFSRNFGHQNAISAGLDHAAGDACIILDGDLQDPPELIPEMVSKWREGHEVVYAVRNAREGEGFFKKGTAAVFYRLLRTLAGVDIPKDTGDFRLMDRQVVDALGRLPERNRFLRGLVSWVGFRQVGIPFDRPARLAGETKFSLFKMLRFALDGITSFSRLPLRLVTLVGLFCFLGSLAVLGWAFYVRLFTVRSVQGWTSLIGVVLFLGGTQLLATGVVGEYIARIFDEAKQRPLYLVRRTHGFPPGRGTPQG